MSGGTSNYPPTRAPMVNAGSNTVAREWLRYFLDLTAGQNAGGQVPKPSAETALDFIRINAAGTAYEVQTPAQALADMGGLTLAEAEALFEPLLDAIEVKSASYQIEAGDTGLAILINAQNGVATLPGAMNAGVKCFIAAGAPGVTIQCDANAYLNGVQGASLPITQGQGAYCEVIKNDTEANAYWSVTYDSGMTFTNGTLTLTGTEWQVGPGLNIELPNVPAFVQGSTPSSTPTQISLPNSPTIGNFIAAVVLTGSTPPGSSAGGLPLLASGVGDGYYSGIYGGFAISPTSPTISVGGTIAGVRRMYEYTNVASVLGFDPTITTSGTISPLNGTFSLNETLACTALSLVLTYTTGTNGTEVFTQPSGVLIRDYFTVEPSINQGFTTAEIPFPNGAGTVDFYPNVSPGGVIIYASAPTVLMVAGGIAEIPEIYMLPLVFENQGTTVGTGYTFNAGAGVAWNVGNEVATLNNTGVLDVTNGSVTATGNISIGSGLTLNAGGTITGGVGIIAQPQGGTLASFHTLGTDGSLIFSGTGTDGLTISEGQIILESSLFTKSATIPSGQNGHTMGTPTIASGATVVIGTGSTWYIGQTFGNVGSVSGSLGIEVAGTLFPTLHAGANISLSGTAPDLTISSGGGGGSTLGVEFNGTLFPTIASGPNITLTPGGATLSISTAGGAAGGQTTLTFSTLATTFSAGGSPLSGYKCTNLPAFAAEEMLIIDGCFIRISTEYNGWIFADPTSLNGYALVTQTGGYVVIYIVTGGTYGAPLAANNSGNGYGSAGGNIGPGLIHAEIGVIGAANQTLFMRSNNGVTGIIRDTTYDFTTGTIGLYALASAASDIRLQTLSTL